MKQYLITAYDYTDAQALDRRMEVRPLHLKGVKELKENHHFILAGAMLDEDGKMIGSTLVLQFNEDAELNQWLDAEPYIKHKVWERVEVKDFRVAVV